MTADLMLTLEKAMQAWQPPEIPEDIPQGDTPGDKIWIWTAAERKSRKDFSGSFYLCCAKFWKNHRQNERLLRCAVDPAWENGYFVPFNILF